MMYVSISIMVVAIGVVYRVLQKNTVVIPEDHNGVVIDRSGFIKQVLPAGRHLLKPGFEALDFIFETKTKLAQGCASGLPTSEGILLDITWSGIFRRDPNLITENTSQHLRGYANTEKGLQRHVEIVLRRLIGGYTLRALFNPSSRDRIERQVTETLKEKLKSSGIDFANFDLQAILPPEEVLHALNQAQAIQALDEAIRSSDGATRQIVTSAHQLDDLIEWGKLFPPYGRGTLTKSALTAS